MISKTDKKTLKKILGNTYAKDVVEILLADELKNQLGNPYNEQHVRTVMSGIRGNKDIETALWQLAAQRKEENQNLISLKNKVTETKKPTVVAAG